MSGIASVHVYPLCNAPEPLEKKYLSVGSETSYDSQDIGSRVISAEGICRLNPIHGVGIGALWIDFLIIYWNRYIFFSHKIRLDDSFS